MYPYKIRVIDPELIRAFKLVSDTGFCKVKPNTARKIGYKIPKNIKRDGIIIHNGNFGVLKNKLFITYTPAYGKRKGYDFEFKTKF